MVLRQNTKLLIKTVKGHTKGLSGSIVSTVIDKVAKSLNIDKSEKPDTNIENFGAIVKIKDSSKLSMQELNDALRSVNKYFVEHVAWHLSDNALWLSNDYTTRQKFKIEIEQALRKLKLSDNVEVFVPKLKTAATNFKLSDYLHNN